MRSEGLGLSRSQALLLCTPGARPLYTVGMQLNERTCLLVPDAQGGHDEPHFISSLLRDCIHFSY
jgi:hypothetical protein